MNYLAYLEVFAGMAEDLFKQWDVVESVLIRFIDFLEKVSLEILSKIN